MPHDVWTPMITINPSPRNKVAHVELLRGLARPVVRYAVTMIYRNQQRKKQKRFSVLRKKEQSQKQKKITTTFGKSLFLIKYRMRCAIYMPPNTKDLAINQTMVAYGSRQNATAFAWANHSDLLRSLKHLMETRLKLLAILTLRQSYSLICKLTDTPCCVEAEVIW